MAKEAGKKVLISNNSEIILCCLRRFGILLKFNKIVTIFNKILTICVCDLNPVTICV